MKSKHSPILIFTSAELSDPALRHARAWDAFKSCGVFGGIDEVQGFAELLAARQAGEQLNRADLAYLEKFEGLLISNEHYRAALQDAFGAKTREEIEAASAAMKTAADHARGALQEHAAVLSVEEATLGNMLTDRARISGRIESALKCRAYYEPWVSEFREKMDAAIADPSAVQYVFQCITGQWAYLSVAERIISEVDRYLPGQRDLLANCERDILSYAVTNKLLQYLPEDLRAAAAGGGF